VKTKYSQVRHFGDSRGDAFKRHGAFQSTFSIENHPVHVFTKDDGKMTETASFRKTRVTNKAITAGRENKAK